MANINKGKRKWRKSVDRQIQNDLEKREEKRKEWLKQKREKEVRINREYKGIRQIDLYTEIDGIKFFTSPEEHYRTLEQEAEIEERRAKESGLFAKRHKSRDEWRQFNKLKYLRTELALYQHFRDSQGFVSKAEAQFIAPQIRKALKDTTLTETRHYIMVELPHDYEIGEETTDRAYIEVSPQGWVKYPMIQRPTRNKPATYGKTPNLGDIIQGS